MYPYVWYNVHKEIIMQTATQTKTKQSLKHITLDSWWSVQNQIFALFDV